MPRSNDTPFRELSYRQQLRHLRSLAAALLKEYGLTGVSPALIRYQHHALYRVATSRGEQLLLRIAGGDRDSPDEFRAQIAWQEALWEDHLPVPEPVRTLDGRLTGSMKLDESGDALCALMRWAHGRRIGDSAGIQVMRQAGALAARLHEHSRRSTFCGEGSLPRWDVTAISEPERWTAGLDKHSRATICKVAHVVEDALLELDTGPDSFGVIQADLHVGNLVLRRGRLVLIDFGDCGRGFYLYDLVIMLEVLRFRMSSRAETLGSAFLEGYSRVAALPKGAAALFPTFLVFRELINLRYVLESQNWRTQQWASRWAPESIRKLETYLKAEGQDAGGPFSLPAFFTP
ncbi:MAG: phosphotransferase [Chloroflexi bacterium]|nr:phosphotransferase [Chloroflexota bacterium]